jgi:putative intracellular protease/amidase
MESRSRRNVLQAGVAAFGLALPIAPADEGKRKEFVCPPCNCGRDHEVFDKPGTCPACGMTLVEKGSAAAPPGESARPGVRAAVLIFDGVQVIDFSAPYEVFGQAGYEVFTVAAEARPIVASMGLRVTPRYALAEAPAAQILLVPGGHVDEAQSDARVLDWIRAQARSATHVISVCNGAFILAATGLLDGLKATTFYDLIEALRSQAPKVTVVSDRRFVDNGKIITTAGEGGMIVTSRLECFEILETLINCGRASRTDEFKRRVAGCNYRVTEFQAALLLGQLERLDELAAVRSRNAARAAKW